MKSLVPALKKSLIIFVAFVQIFGLSVFSLNGVSSAQEVPPAEPVVCSQVSGTNAPTGSSAYTFVFNPATCVWENSYYSWDPLTKVYTPKYDKTPILNAVGTAWEYTEWNFSPASGTYKSIIISIPVPQQIAVQNNDPAFNSSQSPAQQGLSGEQSNLLGGSTIGNTGPNSNNNVSGNNNFNGNINLLNNTQILTTLNSNANSGNAYVMQNTNGGNALTGDAEVIANFLNMIQSSWNPAMGDISVFNAGLFGSFYGDILFNPNAILNTGPSSNNNVTNNNNNDLNINVEDDASIQNDINLTAVSGDATVSQNTNAGNATTGDATAIANVINMINSTISSGQSFIGSLNIYGDLIGDFLLANSLLDELRNTGPNSNNAINNSQNTDIDIDVTKNNSITNNLDLAATSGTALVDSNTNAGNATSGSASTSAKQLNVVGQNSSGTKGLLVFVNVLGVWQGMVWDGAGTSSILGSGPNSSNVINNNTNTNVDANLTQNYSIENNINLNSTSGNATVSQNTNAGNARSGDASSAVNLLNMIDSNLVFTDWFGVLFINVFGSWEGSFGIDTSAGNGPPISHNPPASNPSSSGQPSSNNSTSNVTNSTSSRVRLASSSSNQNSGSNAGEVTEEAATTAKNNVVGDVGRVGTVLANTDKSQGVLGTWIFLVACAALLGFLFRERVISLCKSALNLTK